MGDGVFFSYTERQHRVPSFLPRKQARFVYLLAFLAWLFANSWPRIDNSTAVDYVTQYNGAKPKHTGYNRQSNCFLKAVPEGVGAEGFEQAYATTLIRS